MTSATQTNLFSNETTNTRTPAKRYSIQKYKMTYVREKAYTCSVKVFTHKDAEAFCREFLSELPIEKVCIIALDNGNNIIGFDCSEGSTNQCAVYPTNVFRFLLNTGANSFILSHNHPGGSINPSNADWEITKRLNIVAKQLDISFLDHLIITEKDCYSMRQSSKWN